MKYVCPKCRLPLSVTETGSAVCKSGHSYDRSREGYYNLLLSNAAAMHGDNKEMVESRRRFLDTGAYLPLAEEVSKILSDALPDGAVLLDAGCGEGYYTDIIENRVNSSDRGVSVLGFDISKEAVKRASKRNKRVSFAVSSSYSVPLSDGACDAVINIFSPMASEEMRRVLAPGGLFILAIPDRRHLFELKSVAYENPYENEPSDKTLPGFSLADERRISYELQLDSSSAIWDLFMMTPYAYRTPAAGRERVRQLEHLKTRAEFILLVYRKV